MKKRLLRVSSFLREVQLNWKTTGAIFPSSPRLAKKMAKPLTEFLSDRKPKRILEVGAGTGVMTEEIVKHTDKNDTIVLYELSDSFANLLRDRIENEWSDRNIELRVQPFPKGLNKEKKFDFAVCSLPFNNFPYNIVKECLEAFEDVLRDGGYLTFFEYCYIRRAKINLRINKDCMRLRRIESQIQSYMKTRKISRETVALNIPPAWVHTLRIE